MPQLNDFCDVTYTAGSRIDISVPDNFPTGPVRVNIAFTSEGQALSGAWGLYQGQASINDETGMWSLKLGVGTGIESLKTPLSGKSWFVGLVFDENGIGYEIKGSVNYPGGNLFGSGEKEVNYYGASIKCSDQLVPWSFFSEIVNAAGESINDLLELAAKEFAAKYISPIVFDLDGDGIELTHVNDGVNFDLDNNGIAEQTGWLKGDDGFLVKDLNNNGKIDNQTEMFGTDNTSTALQKLIALDTNGNGKVDGTELSALRIWKDINQDGITQTGELQTLSAAGETNQNLTPPIAANDNYNVQACRFYAA